MNHHKFFRTPIFDSLELEFAPEPLFHRYDKLIPATRGESIDAFDPKQSHSRWHRFFNEIVVNTNTQAFSYARKPLLLYFYEQDWGLAAIEHLKQLSALRNELRYRQINLLVVTSNSLKQFKELSWKENLALDVYEDTKKELASLLKIYAEHSPSWSRYAGIEQNIPLPSLYLLGNDRRISLAFPNEDIRLKLPVDTLLNTWPAAEYTHDKKSA